MIYILASGLVWVLFGFFGFNFKDILVFVKVAPKKRSEAWPCQMLNPLWSKHSVKPQYCISLY